MEAAMQLIKELTRDEMRNIMAGMEEEAYKCCWASDVLEGDYSNCSDCTPAPTEDCQVGSIKVACWYPGIIE